MAKAVLLEELAVTPQDCLPLGLTVVNVEPPLMLKTVPVPPGGPRQLQAETAVQQAAVAEAETDMDFQLLPRLMAPMNGVDIGWLTTAVTQVEGVGVVASERIPDPDVLRATVAGLFAKLVLNPLIVAAALAALVTCVEVMEFPDEYSSAAAMAAASAAACACLLMLYT
jgi:hypothetical protein